MNAVVKDVLVEGGEGTKAADSLGAAADRGNSVNMWPFCQGMTLRVIHRVLVSAPASAGVDLGSALHELLTRAARLLLIPLPKVLVLGRVAAARAVRAVFQTAFAAHEARRRAAYDAAAGASPRRASAGERKEEGGGGNPPQQRGDERATGGDGGGGGVEGLAPRAPVVTARDTLLPTDAASVAVEWQVGTRRSLAGVRDGYYAPLSIRDVSLMVWSVLFAGVLFLWRHQLGRRARLVGLASAAGRLGRRAGPFCPPFRNTCHVLSATTTRQHPGWRRARWTPSLEREPKIKRHGGTEWWVRWPSNPWRTRAKRWTVGGAALRTSSPAPSTRRRLRQRWRLSC